MSVRRKSTRNQRQNRSLEEILHILRQHLPELTFRYKVKSLGVFGSYVRGEARKTSDLDVLVEFSETPDLFKFMELEQDLTTLMRIKVELVTVRALKGNIGKRILSEVVPV